MQAPKLLNLLGLILIATGIIVIMDSIIRYYNTPLGYGNYYSLTIKLFLPISALPIVIGFIILLMLKSKKNKLKG